eukprot:1156746-Pelagomonas_calceolata.AAC.6
MRVLEVNQHAIRNDPAVSTDTHREPHLYGEQHASQELCTGLPKRMLKDLKSNGKKPPKAHA